MTSTQLQIVSKVDYGNIFMVQALEKISGHNIRSISVVSKAKLFAWLRKKKQEYQALDFRAIGAGLRYIFRDYTIVYNEMDNVDNIDDIQDLLEGNYDDPDENCQSDKSNTRISIYSASVHNLAEITKEIREAAPVNPAINTVRISQYALVGGRIDSKTISWEISDRRTVVHELYPEIDIEKLCKAFMKSNDSILILSGEPGTGKTTFVKYLVNQWHKDNLGNSFIYANNLDVINKSEFWTTISGENDSLLILDDISYDMMRPLGEDKTNIFVNSLLAYCDGVVDENAKVIITTNQTTENIDPALLRAGRAFDAIHLTYLNGEEARAIWRDIFNRTDELPAQAYQPNGDVKQCDLMSILAQKINPAVDKTSYRKKRTLVSVS